jgi:hypothetical protein
MKTTLIIITGLNAAVVAGLISRGTADGFIAMMIEEINHE